MNETPQADAAAQDNTKPQDNAPPRANGPLVSWTPGEPIPRPDAVIGEEFYNYREIEPDGLMIEDVELIWWTAAACFSYEVLRKHLVGVIKEGYDPGCFSFIPIADLAGNGRYPSAIIALLRKILPKGALIAVEPEALEQSRAPSMVAGYLVIQAQIWHLMTLRTLGFVPVETLPDHLRDMRFGADLGL